MRRDRRLTPARADLAAAHLKGEVAAARFVDGVVKQVIAPAAPLHETCDPDSRLETQVLFGECVRVYEERDAIAWAQNAGDAYMGYMPIDALTDDIVEPTHRVATLRTILFAAPAVKAPLRGYLSLNAKVTITDRQGRFAHIARGFWLIDDHLAHLDVAAADYVSVAEQFIGAPYLWGGKDFLGLDCSGLVQTALEAAGVPAPRDADQQEAALGAPIPLDVSALRRGDLIFWDGHVAIMRDDTHLLHANAHHMKVAIEPLADALERIAPIAGPPTSVRRLRPLSLA